MKNNSPKIVLLIVIILFFYACSPLKRVSDNELLLVKNNITVNKINTSDEKIIDLIAHKPNSRFVGIPLRLYLYHLSKKEHPDSLYQNWLQKKPNRKTRLEKFLSAKQVDRLGKSFLVSGYSNFFKKVGEAPVIIDDYRIKRDVRRLQAYYKTIGYFDVKVQTKTDTLGKKRGTVTYDIQPQKPYIISSITSRIKSKVVDSVYQVITAQSFFKEKQIYQQDNLIKERSRVTEVLRNKGFYHFREGNIEFEVDTSYAKKTAEIDVVINNRIIKQGDSLVEKPLDVYKISKVNVYLDNKAIKDKSTITDSITYKTVTFYGSQKIKFRPKVLYSAIFINPNTIYSDNSKNLSQAALNSLNVFNVPSITFQEDEKKKTLVTEISLSPKKKFSLEPIIDVTHSNIQDFGISGSLQFTARNLFRGAEILQISTRGNIGSSRDAANPNDVFFNISEYGADMRLSFPRIFFPLKTTSLIKKEMVPRTTFSVGIFNQTNIGLDKENVSGTLEYNWTPKKQTAIKFELLNLQFVRNLNTGNYFNVYRSSYDRLNAIASTFNDNPFFEDANGNLDIRRAEGFIDYVLTGSLPALSPNLPEFQTVRSIGERRERLVEDNLIAASSFTYQKTNNDGLLDRQFYNFKIKLESSGNVLAALKDLVNQPFGSNGYRTLFGVEYSQYIKTDIEYIKHWDLKRNTSIAMRTFLGLAVPYGNSNSIPFSRSYFAGGSNDNRGWQPYSLGPGATGGANDFNEANLKIAWNTEYRFPIFGSFHGAIFADAGNIWNVFDNVTDEAATFDSLESLKDIAIGSGIGMRYDFSFFAFRLDLGFKTYNPARIQSERWFKDFNFSNSVLNFGINYPF